MSVGRQVFEFLKAGAMAHAQWDLEVSMSILKNRKKLLILLCMLLPIFAVAICEGAIFWEAKTPMPRLTIPLLSFWFPSPSGFVPV